MHEMGDVSETRGRANRLIQVPVQNRWLLLIERKFTDNKKTV